MRSSKPITVTLGKQQAILEMHLQSGEYESASEVVRAALKALEREEATLNAIMQAKIREALEDTRADLPVEDVFGRLEQRHAAKLKDTLVGK